MLSENTPDVGPGQICRAGNSCRAPVACLGEASLGFVPVWVSARARNASKIQYALNCILKDQTWIGFHLLRWPHEMIIGRKGGLLCTATMFPARSVLPPSSNRIRLGGDLKPTDIAGHHGRCIWIARHRKAAPPPILKA